MIRIGIFGYGNLGRGVEAAVRLNPDMELVGVFTRRDPSKVSPAYSDTRVFTEAQLKEMQNEIDVLILCGGSATDLPEQTPKYASFFNVVDSFDTHARIPEHFAFVDAQAKAAGKTALISCGWDPGMFSLARLYFDSILPVGATYTFWGRGVSQGHSDAVRRLQGVKDCRQYTVPVPEAMDAVRAKSEPTLSVRQKHTRECFVVAEEGADKARIEREIKTMKNYFDEYDTTVHFISEEEMKRDHSGLPHGGSVIRTGHTAEGKNGHVLEFSIALDSNPEFTGSVIAAFARAVYRMNQKGVTGCQTVFDIPPKYLAKESEEELRAHFL